MRLDALRGISSRVTMEMWKLRVLHIIHDECGL